MKNTQSKSRKNRPSILATSAAALLLFHAGAGAANVTWNHGSAVNNNWSNGGVIGNWFTSAAPANGDSVFFDNGAALNVANTNDIVGLALNSITFNAGATNGTYTLLGNAITLGAGGLTNNTAGVTQTVSLASVTLGAGQTWNAAAGALNVTSAVALNGQTLTVAGGQNTTIGGAVTGAGGLMNNTAAVLTITPAVTFSTGVQLNSGTLTATGGLTVSGGTLTGGGTLNGSLTYTSGTFSNFAGTITGAGSTVTLNSGANSLTLSGNNTYGGITSVTGNSGLIVGSNTALGAGTGVAGNGTTVASGSSLFVNGGVNVANEALTLNGAGVGGIGALVNNNPGNTSTWGGPITIATNSTINAAAGTMNLNGPINKTGTVLTLTDSANSAPGVAVINVNGVISGTTGSFNSDLVVTGLTTNLNNANTYLGPTSITSTNGGGGNGILNANVANALPTANGRTTITMDASGTGNSVLNIGGSAGFPLGANQAIASLVGAASSKVTLGNNTLTIGFGTGLDTNGTANANFAGVISGVGSIIKDETSTQTFSGANTYLGLTNVNGGTLKLGNASALGSTGLGTLVAAGATLDLGGQQIGVEAVSITGTGDATAGINGALGNSSGTAANLAGILTITGASGTVGGAGNIFLDGQVTGADLTKVFADTVFLTNNANNYTTTTITTGTLQVGGLTAGGTSTGVLGTGTVTDNATLNFNRNNALIVGNVINGTGVVNQNGTGTTTLNGANGYTGQTNVNAGTLVLGNATALGTTAGGTVVALGATLDLNGQAVGAEAVTINGTGVGGSGVLVNGSATAASLAGGVTLAGASTIGGVGDISLDGGIVAGAFGITKVGGNTLFLTNNTNTSTTTLISAGTLQVGGSAAGGTAAGALGTGAVTNNSILTINRSNAITVGNTIGGTGVLNQNGTGTTTLNGANTYTGQTNVNAGTLVLGNATALGSAVAGTVVASGASLDLNGQAVGGEAVSIAGVGVGGNGALTNGSATAASLAGTLTLTAPANVGGNAGSISLDGAVLGSALTKVGTDTVFLTSNGNSYTTTTISGGILQVGGATAGGTTSGVLGGGTVTNNATLNFNRSDTITVANTINGTGVLNQNGNGTTNLSGANGYTGQTNVNAGVLEVQNNTALGTGAGATVVATGATLRLANTINVAAEPLTINGNGTGAPNAQGALTVTAGSTATYSGPITVATNSTIHANGGTLNLNGAINKSDVNLTLTGGGIINVNGSITGNVAGFNDDLNVNGTTSNLNAANTYLGPTKITSVVTAGDGVINANVANALPTLNGRTAVTMDAAGLGGSTLNIGGSAGFPLGANQAIASLVGAASSKVTLGANTLTIGFGTAPNTNGTAGANFAGVISGTGGITKNDTSTQILSGTNTYTGATTVTGGTLRAGSGQAFGVNSAVSVGTGAILDLAGNSNSIGSLSDIAGVGGTVQSTVGPATLTTGGLGANTAYAGLIIDNVGPLSLVIAAGAGSQALSNNLSSYTGGTTVNSGTLNIDASSLPGPGTNPPATGPIGTGTLFINGGGIGTTSAGTTNNDVANTVQINNSFNVSGNAVNVIGGGVVSNGVTFSGPVNLTTTPTITTNSGFVDFTGVISGGGNGITFAGSTFTLIGTGGLGDAPNTYTGLTTVQGGLVLLAKGPAVAGANGLAIPGNLQINAGALVQVLSNAASGGATANNQIAPTSNVLVNGTLDIGGTNQAINGLNGSGIVQLSDKPGNAVWGPPFNGTKAGVLTVNNGFFAGKIIDSGFAGQLIKNTPGTLVLTGVNTYTGSTTINNGSLIVNGSIASANTLVNPLGLLGGTGFIGGNVLNAGIVSPGFSPATLTVKGNYTQTPGGTLVIEIAGKGATQHDVLAVGGQANLDGNLRILNTGSVKLKRGDKVTFLTANGGVKGKFATVSNGFKTGNPLLEAQVVYGSNIVSLQLLQGSFAGLASIIGLTPNQIAVAEALDQIAKNPKSAKILDHLDGLRTQEVPQALDDIAPEEFASITALGVSLANVQTANLQRRTAELRAGATGFSSSGYNGGYSGGGGTNYGSYGPSGKGGKELVAPADRVGVFISGAGEFTNITGTNNSRGYDLTTGGFTLGVDYRLTDNFAIGLMAGYANTGIDLFRGGRISVDGGKVGVYATYFTGGFYVDTAVTGGYNTYETQRRALAGTARGSTTGGELNAMVATGYDFKTGGLTIGPTASFQYTYVGIGKFNENGSLAPLQIGGQHNESLRTSVGMKASYDWQVGGVVIRPEVRAAWQHEFGDVAYAVDSRFSSGGGGTFTVNGPDLGRESLLVGAGFAVLWNERTSTYVYYDGELLRTNYNSQNVSGGVRMSF